VHLVDRIRVEKLTLKILFSFLVQADPSFQMMIRQN
jgi:hypothetical protein